MVEVVYLLSSCTDLKSLGLECILEYVVQRTRFRKLFLDFLNFAKKFMILILQIGIFPVHRRYNLCGLHIENFAYTRSSRVTYSPRLWKLRSVDLREKCEIRLTIYLRYSLSCGAIISSLELNRGKLGNQFRRRASGERPAQYPCPFNATAPALVSGCRGGRVLESR